MISDVFIKRPVTSIVISIVIVLVGLIAMSTLPIAQYPDITPPTVQIQGSYIGADAQTVEQTTTTAIETQVNGTPGMAYMSSNSTASGQSGITVTFEVGTDINIATLDVQNRVSVAEPSLPEVVRRLGLTVRKRNPSIFLALALVSPKGTHDGTFLGNYANIYLKDPLLRVPGVGDIFSVGDEFGMRIWLNPDKLASLGVTSQEVIAALTEQNLQIAAGSVGGYPQTSVQAFEYNVLTNSRINRREDFENIIVRSNPMTGNLLYLKDVARVELARFNYGNNPIVAGQRSAFLLLYLAPGANSIDTYNGVMKALDDLRGSFPKDSLPAHEIARLKHERKIILAVAAKSPLTWHEEEQLLAWYCDKVEALLDAGYGTCWLSKFNVADLISKAMKFFNGGRYELRAWVVMPNHVHAVVWPMPGHTLSDILHSWKSYTSKEANKLLQRNGKTFWQTESFDHWIRDDEEHARLVAYVENNPVKAGFCKRPEDWKWSSAIERSARHPA